ncbi:MAG TPA: alpha/beta hydrolase [Bryobacteraceae bacterium]|nr:alpha/beta hydrolase [Bryobacteraceae bacterium]
MPSQTGKFVLQARSSARQRLENIAIILVHGSGAEDREYVLPFARFLIRHGVAILGYDKRGVGGSTGGWNTAAFDDLTGDVLAAFEYLKTATISNTSRLAYLV